MPGANPSSSLRAFGTTSRPEPSMVARMASDYHRTAIRLGPGGRAAAARPPAGPAAW
jgi:hypothetical protein